MKNELRKTRNLQILPVLWPSRVSFSAAILKPGFFRSNVGDATTRKDEGIRRTALAGHCLILALLLAGCSTPSVHQQRLVAKPNMTFSDSVAFSYNSSRLLPQLATGISAGGGSQNSGCTSCR